MDGEACSLAFSADGTTLISASEDGTVRFWDVATGQERGEPLAPDQGGVWSARMSPDGSILATGGGDGTIHFWDAASLLPIGQPLTGHRSGIYTLAFSPDGSLLFSSGGDGDIRQWEVATRQPLGDPIATDQGALFGAGAQPGWDDVGHRGNQTRTLHLWDVVADQELFASRTGRQLRSTLLSPSALIAP